MYYYYLEDSFLRVFFLFLCVALRGALASGVFGAGWLAVKAKEVYSRVRKGREGRAGL